MNTTVENNKIIAEFMGYIDNGCSEEGFLINPITNFDENIDSLKYHSDWNWLMEVILKIGNDTGYTLVMEESNSYWVNLGEYGVDNEQFGGYSNIENIYEACVVFIEWYNEQKN